MLAIAITVFWIVCGVLHYGLFVGYFQTKHYLIAEKYWWMDRITAAGFALAGPAALIATLLLGRSYHWRW